MPILAADSDEDVLGAEEIVDDQQQRLPVPGIQQPAMERRKRSAQKSKFNKNFLTDDGSHIVQRVQRAVLKQPPYLRRMQMEEYTLSQKPSTPAINPNAIIWTQQDQNIATKPLNLQSQELIEPEPEKDKRVTLLERVSDFMYDDMDVVMDYLEENGSPVVSYMSGRVGDIVDEVKTNMEEHPGEVPMQNLW